MCRLLVDAMVWNYIAKARALTGFLASLPDIPVTLTEVLGQIRLALGKWPELNELTLAAERGEIEETELSEEEEEQRIKFLARHPGLAAVDCGLLAVSTLRKWKLLTRDKAILSVAARAGIITVSLEPLLDQAVEGGFLSPEDSSWILAYSNGHTGHRTR